MGQIASPQVIVRQEPTNQGPHPILDHAQRLLHPAFATARTAPRTARSAAKPTRTTGTSAGFKEAAAGRTKCVVRSAKTVGAKSRSAQHREDVHRIRPAAGAWESTGSARWASGASAATPTSWSVRSAVSAKRLVAVVGQDVEPLVPGVLIDHIIAAAAEITVFVHQYVVQRQEPQRSIDVQHAVQIRFQLLVRQLLQRPTKSDQIAPGPLIVLGLQFVQAAIVRDVVAVIDEGCGAAEVRRDLPAGAAVLAEPGPCEVLVELFFVHVHAPALAVDHHPDQVGLRGGNVLPRNMIV